MTHWYEFWNPSSGLIGGVLFAVVMVFVMVPLGLLAGVAYARLLEWIFRESV